MNNTQDKHTSEGGFFRGDSLHNRIRVFFTFIVLLVVVVAYLVYLHLPSTKVATDQYRATDAVSVSGTLLFTSLAAELPEVHLLSLNSEEALIEKVNGYDVTASPEFNDKLNPTEVYFSASTVYSSDEIDQTGLHSWDISTTTVKYYESAFGGMERDINYSPTSGLIAFSRLKDSVESTNQPYQIDDYEIVIINPVMDEVVEILEGGIYPRWSPSGDILVYLTKDGLYTFDLNNKKETNAMGPNEFGTTITPSTAMDVSLDGSRFVITSQGSGVITVLRVGSWSPLTLWVETTVEDPNKFYFNPVISPDGTMYVVIVTDKINGDFINPRLEIRGITENNIIITKSLEGFDPEKFFIDDWIVGGVLFSDEY